ncbi:hypothetical protein H0H93_003623 [Arthromyces matolae]|nr:hypothetical protein H0H93_003623 [Arthromyces matolae]
MSAPGFSYLFNTMLGSPFLTTADLPELVDGAPLAVPHAHTITRPPSPTPTVDSTSFSFVQSDPNASTPNRPPLKSILPRIWDVLSPPRSPYNSYTYSYGSQRMRPKYFDDMPNYSDLEPLDGEEGELVAIDDEACFFIDTGYGSRAVTGIDIIALLPPELALYVFFQLCAGPSALHTILLCGAVSHAWRALATDNTVWRALFISRWDVDLNRPLRSSISLKMDQPSIPALWSAASPSHPVIAPAQKKKRRAKRLFASESGLPFPSSSSTSALQLSSHRYFTPPHQGSRPRHHALSPSSSGPRSGTPATRFTRSFSTSSLSDPSPITQKQKSIKDAPLQLDWEILYRMRLELDRRWNGSTVQPAPSLAPSGYAWGHYRLRPSRHAYPMVPPFPRAQTVVPYAPQVLSISGHTDSVYCLEFDSKRIITGSRDRTIKVWSLKDGRLLGSFGGSPVTAGGEVQGHTGSVLCLKFSADWDLGEEDLIGANRKQGFMVSGSSDCSVCVWSLWTGSRVGDDVDREVKGELQTILRGHLGGVLDLRIDDRWIVSCSKDAVIRVWDRKTWELVRVLRGHEGPVNAVGLQDGRVVSASGDGKMILWDIASGERIRTFEGHDRGLACIEFKVRVIFLLFSGSSSNSIVLIKDGLIVSGSNDCKIKIWNAETGECVRTLLGHEALVRALAFDSRNGRLVSASYDKTVKVWDLNTGLFGLVAHE